MINEKDRGIIAEFAVKLLQNRIEEAMNGDDIESTLSLLEKGLREMMGQPKEFFEIPFMVVSRDDIKGAMEGTDDLGEWCAWVDSLPDEEIENIANQMHKGMMEQYHVCLQLAVKDQFEDSFNARTEEVEI